MATTEKKFQVYTSSMQAHKIVRKDGKVLNIVNGKYITSDEGDIEFLDAEIKAGFKYLTKGEPVTSEQADPMAALRAQIKREAVAEYLAKEQKELEQDMGSTAKEPAKPASSAALASLKEQSSK